MLDKVPGNSDVSAQDNFSNIITRSDEMFSLFRYILNIAGTKQPVLITGERGTGKGVMAKAVHRSSNVSGEFITVKVSGMDELEFKEALFGSELIARSGTGPLSSTRTTSAPSSARWSDIGSIAIGELCRSESDTASGL